MSDTKLHNFDQVTRQFLHGPAEDATMELLLTVDDSTLSLVLQPPRLKFHTPLATALRDDVDTLLEYYSLVELGALCECMPDPLPKPFLETAERILGRPALRRYYRHYRPSALPQLLRLRLAGNGFRTEPLYEEFVRFLTLGSLRRQGSVDAFLEMIDRPPAGDDPLAVALQLLKQPDEVLRATTTKFSPTLEQRGLQGLLQLLTFCSAFDDLLASCSNSPIVRSAFWHYHSYLFRQLGPDLIAIVSSAIESLREYVGVATSADERGRVRATHTSMNLAHGAIERLVSGIYSVEIDQRLLLGIDPSAPETESIASATPGATIGDSRETGPTYTDALLSALTAFDTALAGFGALARRHPPNGAVAQDLDRVIDWANRAGAAASQLRFSCNLIVGTAIDILDFQVRLQGEAAALASALGGMASVLKRQPAIRDSFEDALIALDEAAYGVAQALFPGAIDGVGDVVAALWDFDRFLWRDYTTKFRDAVRDGHLTYDQQARIQTVANDVHQAFEDVNALLNALAENAITGRPAIERALGAVRTALGRAIASAAGRIGKPYAEFVMFVERAGKVARKVDRLLDKLRIPVFPTYEELDGLATCISPGLYKSLGGAQRFALLNIASRLGAISINGRSLLDPAYDVKINKVFPDRIYLDARAELIDDIAAATGQFAPAPAGLHRFKDGGFRGKHAAEGNLQVSFAKRQAGARVDCDCDIDLYRDPFQLFGKVLVNHLTGRTTDQFAVQKILAKQQIQPIGGFELLMA